MQLNLDLAIPGGQVVSWRRERPLRRFTLNQHSGRLALGIYEVRAERFPDRHRGSHDHDVAAKPFWAKSRAAASRIAVRMPSRSLTRWPLSDIIHCYSRPFFR